MLKPKRSSILQRSLLWVSCLSAAVLLAGYAHDKPDRDRLQQRIELNREQHQIPGVSIAVIDDGAIAWAKGFGWADLESGRPVTTKTLFQAQSITKTLTSLAVVKTLQRVGISLDEPVNRYLKSWQIPSNAFTERVPVTFRMLLNHTGAISNPYPDGGYRLNQPLPTLLEVFEGKPPATNPPLEVTAIPGESMKYCNGCYSILQGALEDILNKDFATLMQALVLNPAGMANSTFDAVTVLEDPKTFAVPYDPQLQPWPGAPIRSPVLSTGLMWSTATDLARFNLAFTNALQVSNQLINQALAQQLTWPSSSATRSLGFFIGNRKGVDQEDGKYLYHSGSGIGYLSQSIISKDGQHGAVVLINISPEWDAQEFPQFEFVNETIEQIGGHYGWE